MSSAYTTPLVPGTPVSLTASGAAEAGGGVSIYTDLLAQGLTEQLQDSEFLGVSSTLGEYFVVCAQSGNSSSRLLLTRVPEAAPNQAELLEASTLDVPFSIYTHITMSEATGIFLLVSQTDYDVSTADAFVAAGVVSADDHQISIGVHIPYCSFNYSLAPAISRLDDQHFVMVYYADSDDNSSVVSRVGK